MKNYVLVTGATSGIGYEIAYKFAENNYDLVLTGRNKEKLNSMKEEIEKTYNINVFISSKDLSKKENCIELFKEVINQHIIVDILVNNAGFGYVGEFIHEDIEKDDNMLALNIETVTLLTKLFAKEMAKRNYGKILNVASTGGYHPGPYTAVYYASKAYVLSFSEAISYEFKKYSIVVSTLCPGATKTNFSKNAGKADNSKARHPKYVAEIAYKGLIKGKRIIIPGLENKLMVLLPRWIAAPFIGKYQSGLMK